MAVEDGDAEAMTGDARPVRRDDLSVPQPPQNLQGLALAFLLLAPDEGDDVAAHFGPRVEVLSRPRYGLVRRRDDLQRLKVAPGGEGRDVALDRTVGLHRDEAARRAQPAPLGLDDLCVGRVDLRDDHRDVRRPAVGAVVGHHGRLGAGVVLLQPPELVRGHVDGAEQKVHAIGHARHVAHVPQHEVPRGIGHGSVEEPAALHGLRVGSTGALRAGGDGRRLKPRVRREQLNEPLTDHPGPAEDPDPELLFHNRAAAPSQLRFFGLRRAPSTRACGVGETRRVKHE